MMHARLSVLLFGLPGFAPLALAHPGHPHEGGLPADIVHSFMSMDSALFLFAIGVGCGLWAVGRRVTQARHHAWRR